MKHPEYYRDFFPATEFKEIYVSLFDRFCTNHPGQSTFAYTVVKGLTGRVDVFFPDENGAGDEQQKRKK
jgi:hypothetical protein